MSVPPPKPRSFLQRAVTDNEAESEPLLSEGHLVQRVWAFPSAEPKRKGGRAPARTGRGVLFGFVSVAEKLASPQLGCSRAQPKRRALIVLRLFIYRVRQSDETRGLIRFHISPVCAFRASRPGIRLAVVDSIWELKVLKVSECFICAHFHSWLHELLFFFFPQLRL